MKRLILLLPLFLTACGGVHNVSDYGAPGADSTVPTKSTGDTLSAAEVNDMVSAVNSKEDSLGNPAGNDYFLKSQTDGTRSWSLIDSAQVLGSGTTDGDTIEWNNTTSEWEIVTPTVYSWATAPSVNSGTSTILIVNPDSLAGSYAGAKEIGWTIYDSDTATATGDGVQGAPIPASMDGMNLVDCTCSVYSLNSATGGTTTVVLRRVRGGIVNDMTSTGVTIGYDEYTASDEIVDTTANGSCISSSCDDVQTGDLVFPDVDAITTGAAQQGLSCTALFRLP